MLLIHLSSIEHVNSCKATGNSPTATWSLELIITENNVKMFTENYTVKASMCFLIERYSRDFLAETAKSIPLPIPTIINSTAIAVELPSIPFLPPRDQWTYVQNNEVLFHRKGVEETPQKITGNGNLPKTVIVTGLKKYTEYVFYAHYFGTINNTDQNIITAYSAPVRTDEDGMFAFGSQLDFFSL